MEEELPWDQPPTGAAAELQWELPVSVAELEAVLSNPEQFGMKEGVWYAIDAPQSFADEQPDRCLCARLGISVEQFELLAKRWVLPGTQRAEVLKSKDESVRNLLRKARRPDAPGLAMALARTTTRAGSERTKIRRAPLERSRAARSPAAV